MSNQLWSWVLGLIGVVGFVLAGKRVWWSWYINLFSQALWFAYAMGTKQYGFLISALVYTVVFSQNAIRWTKEHRALKKPKPSMLIGKITNMEMTDSGLVARGFLFKPCMGKNVNVCVAEGCYGEACVRNDRLPNITNNYVYSVAGNRPWRLNLFFEESIQDVAAEYPECIYFFGEEKNHRTVSSPAEGSRRTR